MVYSRLWASPALERYDEIIVAKEVDSDTENRVTQSWAIEASEV